MIVTYILVFAVAVIASVFMLLALSKLAPKLGLIDHPAGRKTHEKSTPVIGGLALLFGAGAAIVTYVLMQGSLAVIYDLLTQQTGFLIGAAILLTVGLIDDRQPLPARYKLLAQLVACSLAVFMDNAVVGGIGIFFGAHDLSLGPFAGPFSILVMLTITNAINMIDGIDGLAGGVMFCAMTIMTKAVLAAGHGTTVMMVAFDGALAAYLLLNFPLFPKQRARVFMGDAGSLLCGFTLGYLAISLSALPFRMFQPSTALWLFFIPVADTIWLYLRRSWYAHAPFSAGRDHIHHLLMERFSARTTTWLLVSISALMAGGAYLAERLGVVNWLLVLIWITAFMVYGTVTHKPWKDAWDRSRRAEKLIA